MIYEFAATQDLHGYDKPWAPGAGINLFDMADVYDEQYLQSDGSYIMIGAIANTTPFYIPEDLVDTECVFSAYVRVPEGSDITGLRLEATENGVTKTSSLTSSNTYTRLSVVFTPTATTDSVKISFGSNASSNMQFKDVQLEIGSSVTSYEPYSNICPPEGFNIWDPTNAEYVQVYAGYVNANTRELYLRPVYQEYAGEELVGPWMSSLDLYEEDATPTEGAFVIDFGGELTSYEITPFMLQTLLDSLGIRQHFTDGAGLLNKLMDQAQGRVRSEEELLHLSRPLNVIAIGDQLPAGLTFKPISKDVLPGLPGKFIR